MVPIPCVATYGKAMKLAWVRRFLTVEYIMSPQVELDKLLSSGDRYMNKFGSNMKPFWNDAFSTNDQFKHEFTVEASDAWKLPVFYLSKS